MRAPLLLAFALAAACGNNDKPQVADSGSGTGPGDAASGPGDAASDARSDGPTSPADSGSGPDGSASIGCADGGTCPTGQMCCVGVPYPNEGRCANECNLDSDRALKDDLAPIDAEAVLARVEKLPIASWHYRSEPRAVRHAGPMAQDFHQAFGVGADDRHIHPVDGIGVSLAAIQALARRVERVERENERLRRELATIEQRRGVHP